MNERICHICEQPLIIQLADGSIYRGLPRHGPRMELNDGKVLISKLYDASGKQQDICYDCVIESIGQHAELTS